MHARNARLVRLGSSGWLKVLLAGFFKRKTLLAGWLI
jgi:hypothetical protein